MFRLHSTSSSRSLIGRMRWCAKSYWAFRKISGGNPAARSSCWSGGAYAEQIRGPEGERTAVLFGILDVYGIPIQTAQRLRGSLQPASSLDEVLARLSRM